jgi:aminomuconate-semialdehyde/2-hydroxymuconate-6-semialdehyde dehydrogenase
VCLGTERVYVQRPIFERSSQALKAKAEAVKYGRPDDPDANYGPLISQEHRAKVLSYYRKAVEEGRHRRDRRRGARDAGRPGSGAWVQPTIWTGLPESATVVQRGNLRPVLPHPLPSTARTRWSPGQRHRLRPVDHHLDQQPGRATAWRPAIEVGITWINSWFLRDLRTPSAVPNSRASAVKAACIRWSSTPNPQRLRETLRLPHESANHRAVWRRAVSGVRVPSRHRAVAQS